ncbi:hypothetical protein ILP97_37855 [Amycolatopsis sp. H6(2020)]|nr:hypothetical protein [Amycolatopsis sp. H6(2020)]
MLAALRTTHGSDVQTWHDSFEKWNLQALDGGRNNTIAAWKGTAAEVCIKLHKQVTRRRAEREQHGQAHVAALRAHAAVPLRTHRTTRARDALLPGPDPRCQPLAGDGAAGQEGAGVEVPLTARCVRETGRRPGEQAVDDVGADDVDESAEDAAPGRAGVQRRRVRVRPRQHIRGVAWRGVRRPVPTR